jgi:O-antigen ligase
MGRLIALGLLYFWAIVNVDESIMSLGLYCAVPGAFVLSVFCAKENILKNKYYRIFIGFFGWILFTWFFALNTEAANHQLQRLLGVFMLTTAVCNLATDQRNQKWLQCLYVLVFIIALNYARGHILTTQFDIKSDRLDDDRLNANILANYTVYATFALYVLGNIVLKRWMNFTFRILFLLMIPLTFIIAILTASRQVLLVQIPLFTVLLYLRYFKNVKIWSKLCFIALACIAVFMSVDTIIQTYDNSYLKVRNETKIEDDGRFKVLVQAIEVGNSHPLTGVGPGNFYLLSTGRIFSHCSYTEAYANSGIIGLILFLYLIGYYLKQQYVGYRRTLNKKFLEYLTFGIVFAFYNFFYVFYSDLWLMSYFMFVAYTSGNALPNYQSR